MLISECGQIWEATPAQYKEILCLLALNTPVDLNKTGAICLGRIGFDLTHCTRARAKKMLDKELHEVSLSGPGNDGA